jgi:hypothetical protein
MACRAFSVSKALDLVYDHCNTGWQWAGLWCAKTGRMVSRTLPMAFPQGCHS